MLIGHVRRMRDIIIPQIEIGKIFSLQKEIGKIFKIYYKLNSVLTKIHYLCIQNKDRWNEKKC